MCGIVGILSKHEAAPVLIELLKRLEYRGYDSAGIALLKNGKLSIRREVGKLANLSDSLIHAPLSGYSGIGHTRWATHGKPTNENAHPHSTERVALVHNGIIENHAELREEVLSLGYICKTQTDTEVVLMLVDYLLQKGKTPKDAVKEVIKRLKGAYALCFVFRDEDNLLIVARNGAPLVIGYRHNEKFVCSDANAISSHVDRIIYLKDGDYGFVQRDNIEIFNKEDTLANRSVNRVQNATFNIDKAGHKHFMSKEIFEQPQSLAYLLEVYWNDKNATFKKPLDELDFTKTNRIKLIGCGTAYLACMVAKYWFEAEARISVQLDIASEFICRDPVVEAGQMTFFVSQSGETADTLAALEYCRKHDAYSIAIVNAEQSSIAGKSAHALPICAGVEIGVASTKAFMNQIALLRLIALKSAHDRKQLSDKQLRTKIDEMMRLPDLICKVLETSEKIASISASLRKVHSTLFLGRGIMYPLALEGALKLKEVSYIHAEGFPAGELKHGPMALIDENMPVVVFAPSFLNGGLFEKTMSNIEQVTARRGRVLLISDDKGVKNCKSYWKTLILPEISASLAPIVYAPAVQLLAYHSAVAKGTDVDQPRNLAKSVTVE